MAEEYNSFHGHRGKNVLIFIWRTAVGLFVSKASIGQIPLKRFYDLSVSVHMDIGNKQIKKFSQYTDEQCCVLSVCDMVLCPIRNATPRARHSLWTKPACTTPWWPLITSYGYAEHWPWPGLLRTACEWLLQDDNWNCIYKLHQGSRIFLESEAPLQCPTWLNKATLTTLLLMAVSNFQVTSCAGYKIDIFCKDHWG